MSTAPDSDASYLSPRSTEMGRAWLPRVLPERWAQRWSWLPIRSKLWLILLPVQFIGLAVPGISLLLTYESTKNKSYYTQALAKADTLARDEKDRVYKAWKEKGIPNDDARTTPNASDTPDAQSIDLKLGTLGDARSRLRMDYIQRSLVASGQSSAIQQRERRVIETPAPPMGPPIPAPAPVPPADAQASLDGDRNACGSEFQPVEENGAAPAPPAIGFPPAEDLAGFGNEPLRPLMDHKRFGWFEDDLWEQIYIHRPDQLTAGEKEIVRREFVYQDKKSDQELRGITGPDENKNVVSHELSSPDDPEKVGSWSYSDGHIIRSDIVGKIHILTLTEVLDRERIIVTVLEVPLEPLKTDLRRMRFVAIAIFLLSFGTLLGIIDVAVGRNVVFPVQQLAKVMRQAEPATLGAMRVEVLQSDEIGDLQQSFNDMAGEISKKQQELQQSKDLLEERVELRTAELATRNDELSQTNAALVQTQSELENVNQELAKKNEELDAFAYSISHDLQAPLRNIRFLVNTEIPKALKKQDQATVEQLLAESSQLCAFNTLMVQEMLKWARAGRESQTIEPVDVNRTVEEVRAELRMDLEKTGATITVTNRLPVVLCGSINLRRILTNLITNGIKYNEQPKKGIEIGALRSDNGEVTIFVRDNGIGISPENLKEVFKMLVQLHKPSRFEKGVGMGLAIVKKLVESYKGTIRVESTLGSGTTFWITLPLAPSETTA